MLFGGGKDFTNHLPKSAGPQGSPRTTAQKSYFSLSFFLTPHCRLRNTRTQLPNPFLTIAISEQAPKRKEKCHYRAVRDGTDTSSDLEEKQG